MPYPSPTWTKETMFTEEKATEINFAKLRAPELVSFWG